MAAPTFASLGEYLAATSPQGRAALEVVRREVLAQAPEAIERLSYGMPTFFVGGKRVVHMAAWATHLALYPVPRASAQDPDLPTELAAYVKGKGTLHFDYGELPEALIARVVRAHLTQVQ